MGLKIGERMHPVDIDENAPISLQENNYKHNITFPYMYEIFILRDINLMFLYYYQNTNYFHNYGYVSTFL
jgi:hypothetical protein